MNLQEIVHTASAIRLRQRLLPEGGATEKIFPPTFPGGKYCWEHRRINERSIPCVLLDSVASQANRLEESLADLVAEGTIELPRLAVRFDGELADLGEISTLATPHRVFDAIFRDSKLANEPFFKTALYGRLAKSNVRNATALFASAPTALIFGCWDSAGAAGGSGNKFARIVTSEIVGINAEVGETQGGVRRDGLDISAGVEIAIQDDGDWVVKGKSSAGKKEREKGTRPSEINHGNILIKVESAEHERVLDNGSVERRISSLRGGVTVDYALQTTVLSLTGLRRLRFPLPGAENAKADGAARTVLAALAIVAITANREHGYWLRSRCGLVADGPQDLEIVAADGQSTALPLDNERAIKLYQAAISEAQAVGLPWDAAPVLLTPQPKLIDLIRKSRAIQSLGQ